MVGVRADRDTYSVMAASWKFDKYANLSNKDDDGMNKESEIINELIEDERHDCDTPEVTEWMAGEKPPCGVWLELLDPVDGRKYVILKYKYISDRLALFVEMDAPDFEQAGEWKHFAHKLYVDPKEKHWLKLRLHLLLRLSAKMLQKKLILTATTNFRAIIAIWRKLL